MKSSPTIHAGMTAAGFRRARYGDFVVITLSNGAFAVTAQDMMMVETWARGRTSFGNAQRDQTAFTDRFDNVLARSGSGIATKGSRPVLARIVAGMMANGIDIKEWSVPHNINESVEVVRRKPPVNPLEPPA
ncbi:MAG TPA: hypothetical protein VHE37_11825 [Nevskiaceae bacterium]|nr:hypothetical protein [Nevskiaceae bacterium]